MNLEYKENLSVTKNFKVVNYDGVNYQVRKLIKLVKNEEEYKHICIEGYPITLSLDWAVEIPKKGLYNIAFCNKCKTLVIKKIK